MVQLENRLRLTKNKKVRDAVLNRLDICGGYCPCIPITDDAHICPCKDMREGNECHCGLFVKE